MFVGWARSRRWAVCVFWRLGVAGYFAAKVVNGGTRCPQRVDDNTPSAPNLTSSSEKPIHLSLSAARDGGSYNNEAFIRLGVSCIIAARNLLTNRHGCRNPTFRPP